MHSVGRLSDAIENKFLFQRWEGNFDSLIKFAIEEAFNVLIE